tara:strand:+ start:304 stop:948 length:645 start_codon:yes stop_codon:yes gene_type:complete
MKTKFVALFATILIAGCQTTTDSSQNGTETSGARYTIGYDNQHKSGSLVNGGVGIEGRDIIELSRFITADLEKNFQVLTDDRPRVIIDSKYFINDSASAIDTNILTDKLRANLIRLMKNKIVFVGRQNILMVMKERELKSENIVSSRSNAEKVMGADYRFSGRITTAESVNPRTGHIKRYNQINLEIIDLSTSEIVWSQIFSFEKMGRDNVIYR